jgi:Flp pilus assembly protein TadD
VFYRRGQVRKALNLEAMGRKDDALTLLEDAAKANPKDATALITRGDMLRELQRYGDAAEAYTSAIGRSEPLGSSDWPLLYARGISYERSGQWEKAEADLTRALQLQPNQPDVLNYLAYSWLTQGKNLLQARQYLDAALAERPDDPHIIDSAGWARYLAGDYKAAVTQLETAVDRMPDDVTVNDHLGDAYWRVGREIEARYQWERALNFKPSDDAAAALRDKLAKGLPPVTGNAGTAANAVPTAVAGTPAVSQTP